MPLLPLAMPRADVRFNARFLPPADADALLRELTDGIAWRQEPIRLFGREVLQPRLIAWHGDAGAAYRYSGLQLQPAALTPTLHALRLRLQQATGATYNSVLLNLYRHGQDSMGWHADDEPELGPAPVIASLSLGATRRFRFRRRPNASFEAAPVSLDLPHGSLLLMQGPTQHNWQHALPKTARPVGPRINLTFRNIIS
ncbi:alpha-ketoglutarate-dependent dioxygenase AlkB family protein [Hymenobacter latericus]|uniref:alpha-ketoglutarate-dependent dioxygenase AlkB family protein n=1 Tax=Hymenobacter sp. YIM 151858-1 TaxID=2987688 RepID=UPI0022268654|nr:alpha-ketoglutarate-dependent dioxygenase AlkB [Hymenobacter sp. YIM 151858-1]UYZ58528.1 alpha-ketoglutarate-dependent dioxygenase AlkB [Hymenobacter sp. YIM 151858-1]